MKASANCRASCFVGLTAAVAVVLLLPSQYKFPQLVSCQLALFAYYHCTAHCWRLMENHSIEYVDILLWFSAQRNNKHSNNFPGLSTDSVVRMCVRFFISSFHFRRLFCSHVNWHLIFYPKPFYYTASGVRTTSCISFHRNHNHQAIADHQPDHQITRFTNWLLYQTPIAPYKI